MPRPKKRETLLAEEVIKRAIARETEYLSQQIAEKDKRIRALEAALRGVSESALRAIGVSDSGKPPKLEQSGRPEIPKKITENELADIPQGPAVDLDDEDNLGEGRWV